VSASAARQNGIAAKSKKEYDDDICLLTKLIQHAKAAFCCSAYQAAVGLGRQWRLFSYP